MNAHATKTNEPALPCEPPSAEPTEPGDICVTLLLRQQDEATDNFCRGVIDLASLPPESQPTLSASE
jgi:hypothetical protein